MGAYAVMVAELAVLEERGGEMGERERLQVRAALTATTYGKHVVALDDIGLGERAVAAPAVDELVERGLDLRRGLRSEPCRRGGRDGRRA